MKIAVVGAGIAGLACAHRLAQQGQDVTLYEGGGWFGGHSNTVDVTLDGVTHGVDTGFLVYNNATYPHLTRLFADLGVETAGTDMSFSVKLPLGEGEGQLEWAGASLATVFAQRRNLLRPAFLGMLRDILRFNRAATALATALADGGTPGSGLSAATGTAKLSLGHYLDLHRYGQAFRDWYLLPMAACIWSCPTGQMLEFPLASFVRFCHNHGLLQVSGRPQWRTVKGGSREYVRRMLEGIPQRRLNTPVRSLRRSAAGGALSVALCTDGGTELFDEVVLACHSDQALALLERPSRAEREVLGAIGYQPNRAVLHTDSSCLPARRKAWSAWNYQGGVDELGTPRVCVHYLLNMLQPLPFTTPVMVSLNPVGEPAPGSVLASFDYAHPVFDQRAVAAQARLAALQGEGHVWFAGAWTGYGFHEDGLKSGLQAAAALVRKSALSHAA
ncbi:NADH-ubiquinone oxidoreductase subunit 6 [Massilia sp. Root351]|jgi:predicted NAD/FAD-binding protein|uniref:NAD(P)/FAD-dependent oxidoreductase n=1 Tax=Massilia sp. Root351 TaxID=1736522 RepID=UPI00070F04E8|nr:FAD-dependent oxidoreductase [Massilia sp. Root351]KQV90381.1 NADH-ubiquinone oxidoreductase subunit 6 [Massilia sp. Root351]